MKRKRSVWGNPQQFNIIVTKWLEVSGRKEWLTYQNVVGNPNQRNIKQLLPILIFGSSSENSVRIFSKFVGSRSQISRAEEKMK